MKRRTSRRFQPTMTQQLDQLESRQLLSSGFQVVTSPTVSGASLNAVTAVSPTDIWAVGSQSSGPLIENFNGTSWSVVPSPSVSGGVLNGVSAASSNDVWAVGSNGSGAPLVEFFNGTSWSVQTTPTLPANGNGNDTAGGGEFAAVAAISPTDVWAVGGLGNGRGGELIENFNGTTWSVVTSPSPTSGGLLSISAISSTDIVAVGFSGGEHPGNQVVQFNGTTWSELSTLPSGEGETQAVDAISPTDIWVVGGAGIENYNGTSWSVVAAPVGDLVAISGTSANNIFAVGHADLSGGPEDGGTFVEQWNGTSWSPVTSANPGATQDSLSGVTALSNGTVVTVGDSFPGAFIETNATTAAPASRVSTPASTVSPPAVSAAATPAAATTVSGSSANNIHAVGTSATTVVAVGTLENDSSTLGTKTKGLIELN